VDDYAATKKELASVASPRGHELIDRELYLLEPWIADRDRCRRVGIPDEVEFATKPRQAMEMPARAFAAGVVFGWVTADEAYGQVTCGCGWRSTTPRTFCAPRSTTS
jgi:SRSO17 transposase